MKVTLSAPSGLPRVSSFSRKGSFSRKKNSNKKQQHEARTSKSISIAGGRPPIAPVAADARDDHASSSDGAGWTAIRNETSALPETRDADQQRRPPRPTAMAKAHSNNKSPPDLLPTVEPVKRKGSFNLRPPKFGRSGSFIKRAQKQKQTKSSQQKAQAGSSGGSSSSPRDETSEIDAGHLLDDQEDLKSKWRAVNDTPDGYHNAATLFDGRSSMNHGWHRAEVEKHQAPLQPPLQPPQPSSSSSSWRSSLAGMTGTIEQILGVEMCCSSTR